MSRWSMLPLFILALACLPAFSQNRADPEPGVHATGRISLVEHPQNADTTSVPLHSNKLATNTHTGSNLARGLVYAGPQNTIEVSGPSSDQKLATDAPVFYIRISDDEDDQQTDDDGALHLIRLTPTKDSRIVITFSANVFGGSRKRQVEDVAITAKKLDSGYLKITPVSPLPPGEYGLLYLPKDKNAYGNRVYDFSIPAK